METVTAYIDDYFNNALPPEERLVFEQRCLDDKEFAEEVARYLVLRQEMQLQADNERKERWRNLPQLESTPARKGKLLSMRSWGWVAAAAGVILLMFLIWPGKNHLRSEAGAYIAAHFTTLGVSMDSRGDDLQEGVSQYNNGLYAEAARTFSAMIKKDPNNIYALRYRGLSYLMQQDYDAAIADFDALSNIPDLASNPGYFYKALALLQRNRPGDALSARELLQYVIDHQLEGEKEARRWLK